MWILCFRLEISYRRFLATCDLLISVDACCAKYGNCYNIPSEKLFALDENCERTKVRNWKAKLLECGKFNRHLRSSEFKSSKYEPCKSHSSLQFDTTGNLTAKWVIRVTFIVDLLNNNLVILLLRRDYILPFLETFHL